MTAIARKLGLAISSELSDVFLPILRDPAQLRRFSMVSTQYTEFCDRLDPNQEHVACYASGPEGYDWKRHTRKLRDAFQSGVPLDFLRQPTISATMVYRTGHRDRYTRLNFIRSTWPEAIKQGVLREDYIGQPRIVGFPNLTSDNRIHHMHHLTVYQAVVGKGLVGTGNHIVEWGGGYGNLARLIHRLNPVCTYTIIDLPELCALQYVYLYSLLGEAVHLVIPDQSGLLDGRINVVSVGSVLTGKVKPSADIFISTWGLTESPRDSQMFACKERFWGAENILLAYSPDPYGDVVRGWVSKVGCVVTPVLFAGRLHEYAFR